MTIPILAIGVGGTGIKAIVRVKERMIEAYGKMPDEVAVLGIDTVSFDKANETFNGVMLEDNRATGRPTEFIQIVTDPQQRVQTAYQMKRENQVGFEWVNPPLIESSINEAQHYIVEGAGQVRPIGRVAVSLNYARCLQEIQNVLAGYNGLFNQIAAKFAGPDDELKKLTIFIVGSMAGGTGSGSILSIAMLVRDALERLCVQNTAVAGTIVGIITGSDAFENPDDAANHAGLKGQNTVAFLRELNRYSRPLTGTINDYLPRYVDQPNGFRQTLKSGFFDHTFILGSRDRKNRLATPHIPDSQLKVITPTIADFIVAHTDEVIYDRLV